MWICSPAWGLVQSLFGQRYPVFSTRNLVKIVRPTFSTGSRVADEANEILSPRAARAEARLGHTSLRMRALQGRLAVASGVDPPKPWRRRASPWDKSPRNTLEPLQGRLIRPLRRECLNRLSRGSGFSSRSASTGWRPRLLPDAPDGAWRPTNRGTPYSIAYLLRRVGG